MESLINDIRVWYSRNMLKLNDSKTEMLIIISKFRQNFHFRDISFGESIISPSPTIRDLGVIMVPTYTMSSHVSHLVQVAFLKLRALSYVRCYLTDESTKTAVHAYITSRLDYCNSLLLGLPQELTMKMQSVMNAAARLVTKTRKFDHITPVLRDLHWLHASYRCQFKILLLVFKCIHKLAPTYLCKRLTLKPKRGLRSDNILVLDIPLTKLKLKTYGDRSFSFSGPTLWNKLPSDIRLSEPVDIINRNLKPISLNRLFISNFLFLYWFVSTFPFHFSKFVCFFFAPIINSLIHG